VGVRLTFPIAKTIIRGSRLYADALYASLFFESSLTASREFLLEANAGQVRDVVFGASDARRDGVSTHTAGVNLKTGLFKHYLFFRTLSLTCTYELMSGDIAGDISFTF
jgi:hypothetical protein